MTITSNGGALIRYKETSQEMATPSSVTDLYKTAELLQEGGLFPNANNTAGLFTIIQYGREIGIAPVTALKNISIVKGNICMTAQVMLGLARKVGVKTDIVKEEPTGCTVNFTRGEEKYTSTFSEEDARRAGLLGKDNWKNYPIEMYRWRAVAKGLRVIASDVIAGTYMPEELENISDGGRTKPMQGDTTESMVVNNNEQASVSGELVSPDLIKALHAAFSRVGLTHFRNEFKSYCTDEGWLEKPDVSFNTLKADIARELLDDLEEHMLAFYSIPKYHTMLKSGFSSLKLDDKKSVLYKMSSYVEDIDSLPKKIGDMSEAFLEDAFQLFLTVLKNQHHNEIVDATENGMNVDDAVGTLNDLGMQPKVVETAQIASTPTEEPAQTDLF